MNRIALVVACCLAIPACAEPRSFLVHRPEDTHVDAAVTAMWSHEIHGVARDGDWILTRSYYAVADAIATVTPGEDLSHASIYDAKTDTVIEVIGSGVREIPLDDLVDRNHYMIVVRPGYESAEDGTRAVERARAKIGTAYDVTGMFGFDDPEKFYCSELVWWASQGEDRTGDHHTVITPAGLMEYGAVIYWSGKRTDPQVMDLAVAREAQRVAAN